MESVIYDERQRPFSSRVFRIWGGNSRIMIFCVINFVRECASKITRLQFEHQYSVSKIKTTLGVSALRGKTLFFPIEKPGFMRTRPLIAQLISLYLGFPLLYGNSASAENQNSFPDCASGRHSDQRLPGATGKNDDSAPSPDEMKRDNDSLPAYMSR